MSWYRVWDTWVQYSKGLASNTKQTSGFCPLSGWVPLMVISFFYLVLYLGQETKQRLIQSQPLSPSHVLPFHKSCSHFFFVVWQLQGLVAWWRSQQHKELSAGRPGLLPTNSWDNFICLSLVPVNRRELNQSQLVIEMGAPSNAIYGFFNIHLFCLSQRSGGVCQKWAGIAQMEEENWKAWFPVLLQMGFYQTPYKSKMSDCVLDLWIVVP